MDDIPTGGLSAALIGLSTLILALVASYGALMFKRDYRASVGWLGLIWLVPLLGPILYFLFGINRIRRRARQLGREARDHALDHIDQAPILRDPLYRCAEKLASFPQTQGNTVTIYNTGDGCYQAMWQAIAKARQRIVLSSYIFQNDSIGRQFVRHLQAAHQRGVEVRVLVDGAGLYYSLPTIWRLLRQTGVPSARFLHSLRPWRMPFINLRNHRKLMIVDERIGFTGGMNIAQRHSGDPPQQQDLHFSLRGPVVEQMAQVFAEDWAFTTGESLEPLTERNRQQEAGTLVARGLVDGPDADFDRLRWALLAALREARQEIIIITPYFLPDPTLITAINAAALTDVRIVIVVPERSNFRFVDWAMSNHLESVLRYGCEVYFAKPPFDHSKMMLIDRRWAMVGSANWDARSLRLNFEFNLELIGEQAVDRLHQEADRKIANSRRLTLRELRSKSLPARLRNALARLLTPYL